MLSSQYLLVISLAVIFSFTTAIPPFQKASLPLAEKDENTLLKVVKSDDAVLKTESDQVGEVGDAPESSHYVVVEMNSNHRASCNPTACSNWCQRTGYSGRCVGDQCHCSRQINFG